MACRALLDSVDPEDQITLINQTDNSGSSVWDHAKRMCEEIPDNEAYREIRDLLRQVMDTESDNLTLVGSRLTIITEPFEKKPRVDASHSMKVFSVIFLERLL